MGEGLDLGVTSLTPRYTLEIPPMDLSMGGGDDWWVGDVGGIINLSLSQFNL